MQISTELIHGVKMAASMAQNIVGDANRLMANEPAKKPENTQRVLEAAVNAAVEEAVEQAERKGIRNAVLALLESGVAYEDIVSLLKKYWDIADSSAREQATRAQTVDYPAKQLGIYLQSQGWEEEEIRQFIKEKGVRKQLRQNHLLWKLTPEELLKQVKNSLREE